MPRPEILKRVVAFTLLLGLLSVLMLLFGLFGSAEGVGAVFCEASREGLIKQPANTFSNLGFIAVGLLIAFELASGRHDGRGNLFARSTFTAVFFSCLAVFLGYGSMAMHATETRLGGFLDMLSMYLVASFMVSYAAQRLFGFGPFVFSLLFAAMPVSAVMLQELPYRVPVVGYMGNLVFGTLIVLSTSLELLHSLRNGRIHERKWAFLSLLSVLTAFGIWNLWHNDSPLCDPESLMQGHAVWHLLTALALYLLFRYYVSEEGTDFEQ